MRKDLHLLTLPLQVAVFVDATSVSVCRDATYEIPSDRGPICSGSGSTPMGFACPLKGDATNRDCHSGLSSFTSNGCVAKKDAQCVKLTTGVWGCVYITVGCNVVDIGLSCPKWVWHDDSEERYYNDALVDFLILSSDAHVESALEVTVSEHWFTDDAPPGDLYACNQRPTTSPPTQPPTTSPPSTPTLTTIVPVVSSPTTRAVTTLSLTTSAPSTPVPTTTAPSNLVPTTTAPPTPAPTTPAPTTLAPSTTTLPTRPPPTPPPTTTPPPTPPTTTTPPPTPPLTTTAPPCYSYGGCEPIYVASPPPSYGPT